MDSSSEADRVVPVGLLDANLSDWLPQSHGNLALRGLVRRQFWINERPKTVTNYYFWPHNSMNPSSLMMAVRKRSWQYGARRVDYRARRIKN